MKRIAVCILVGVGCSLVAFALIQLRKSNFRYGSNNPLYNAELKIKIGDLSEDKRSITIALSQIKKRIDFSTDLSAKQLDKNNFLLSIKKVSDSTTIKTLVSESIEVRFSETFLITEIADYLNAVEDELSRRRRKTSGATDSTDKYEFLLEGVDIETKKKNGTCRLNQLINFFSSVQDNSGRVRFPAALGRVKTKDTVYLNKILKDEGIKSKFPADLFFAYDMQTGHFRKRDSVLDFYALKATNPELYPLPTGDNIEDCRVDFEPTTGYPVIAFELDAEGSNYWYTMTKRNTGKAVAIQINGFVLTAPVVEEAIPGGASRISGDFTLEEARNLASMIRTSRLALPVQIVESKFEPVEKSFKAVWLLGLVFLLSSFLAYGISFIIRPASKP